MKSKFNIFFALIFFASISLLAQNENTGTSGFTFLKVNYSARAAAMGNAYTGLANEADAVFFNPAGLVQLKSPQASLTYMNYLEGINCGSAVYAHPMNDKTVFAFFAKGLTATEDRTIADEMGQYAGVDGTFGMSDLVFGISAARYVLDILDVGINIKFIQESLDENSASAAVFDLAILHQTTNKYLKLGIAVRNIGKQLSYFTDNEYQEDMPTTFTAGFNYHPKDKIYVTIDVYKPADNDFFGHLGIEYQVHTAIALRAGYKTNATDWATGGDKELFSGISFGSGFDLKKYNMKLDYAIVSFGDLGFVNQISIKYIF
ncbi:MAG: PorV/PorQ family protein [Candidatus Cloacimonetes bacterium]|nr:PorV/PorQ family protein [Candidatus Cloacimonadota bacterium]